MSKDKLSQIVDSVYKATVSGSMKWSLTKFAFNSDTRHRYGAVSPDGITKFYCEVRLTDNMVQDPVTPLHIENPNMVDDGTYLYPSNYPVVKLLQEWLYKTHVLPSIKIANQDAVMDDILKGIDVSEYRDRKLEDILGEDKPKEEKSSLISRIFKK